MNIYISINKILFSILFIAYSTITNHLYLIRFTTNVCDNLL